MRRVYGDPLCSAPCYPRWPENDARARGAHTGKEGEEDRGGNMRKSLPLVFPLLGSDEQCG